jgi:hypothetical protein
MAALYISISSYVESIKWTRCRGEKKGRRKKGRVKEKAGRRVAVRQKEGHRRKKGRK